MDFRESDRAREYRERLEAFMDECVYPAEATIGEQVRALDGVDPRQQTAPTAHADEDRAADHEDERAEHPPLLPLDAALGEVGPDAGGEGFVDGHGSSLSDGERCAPSRRSAAGGLAPRGAVTDLW